LAIMLSFLLRYADNNCPFGIFKLFFHNRLLITEFQLYWPIVGPLYG
jgi:hypothetical protein